MIEQILAFVLGAGTGFLIWGVVLAFMTARKLKGVQEELPNIYACIDNLSEELHRRIDQEISRTDELYRDSIKHTDSRVDKLESKFESKFDNLGDIPLQLSELRQRINNTIELVNDITGLTVKKK